MDLVHQMPHAFMNSGDDSASNAAIIRSMTKFQDVAKFDTHNSKFLLQIEGYPDIEETNIVLAVDSMNKIHHGLNKAFYLTIRLHMEQIAMCTFSSSR